MHNSIKEFLTQQTCTAICCVDEDGKPHCFNCYYIFDEEKALLHFKSSTDSKHFSLLRKNPCVAGTVLPDRLNKLSMKGAQWQGVLLSHLHHLTDHAWGYYHKKFPVALAIKGEVFTIRLTNIKMTASKMGFGKKVIWDRSEENHAMR